MSAAEREVFIESQYTALNDIMQTLAQPGLGGVGLMVDDESGHVWNNGYIPSRKCGFMMLFAYCQVFKIQMEENGEDSTIMQRWMEEIQLELDVTLTLIQDRSSGIQRN